LLTQVTLDCINISSYLRRSLKTFLFMQITHSVH